MFTHSLEVVVLSLRRGPALLALMLVLVSLASACNEKKSPTEEGGCSEENPTACSTAE
jgi:hypothetical protein